MLNSIEKQEALELLQKAINCTTFAPEGHEIVLAKLLAQVLTQEKLTSNLDEFQTGRANLTFKLPGKKFKPALLVSCPLDTASQTRMPWKHNPLGAELHEHLLYGPGAAASKASLVALLYSCLLLKRQNIQLPQELLFLATAGKETGSLGALHFTELGGMKDIGALLLGAPTGGSIVTAHRGRVEIGITTKGQAAPAGQPYAGSNAILAMSKFIQALQEHPFVTTPHHSLGEPTFTVCAISGDAAGNMVPDKCSCRLLLSTLPGQTKSEVEEKITQLFKETTKLFPAFKGCFKLISWLEPVLGLENSPMVKAFRALTPRAALQTGGAFTTDASAFLQKGQLPLVIYGPGASKNAYRTDEFVEMDAFYEAIEVYYQFLRTYELEA